MKRIMPALYALKLYFNIHKLTFECRVNKNSVKKISVFAVLAYVRQCGLTIKPSYILLHKDSLILRLLPSCCRFPRVPAVSAAPPIVSHICSPIG